VASNMHDVRYWLARAEDARRQAEEMTRPPARREMLQIAAGYHRLAKHAEERAIGKIERQSNCDGLSWVDHGAISSDASKKTHSSGHICN
jgi:hypothetical protein